MISTEVILFGIRAGIHLGQEARQAYIDGTKRRELVLPLPKVDFGPTVDSALRFFQNQGKEFVSAENPRLLLLHRRARDHILTEAEGKEYLELRHSFDAILSARRNNNKVKLQENQRVDADELTAMVTIKQWEKDDPADPKTLHRFAGTIIELGIDYFTGGPGTIQLDSREGKLIAGFVEAIDNIAFAEILVEEHAFEKLIGQFFVATLETLSTQPEFVSSDDNVKDLVKVTTHGLANDLQIKLKALEDDSFQTMRLEAWGEWVFRSLLSSAGRHVVEHPSRFLGVKGEPEGALITRVGSAVIDLAITDKQIELKRVFSRHGLEEVMRASLHVVAEYPELVLGDDPNKGLRGLVAGVAASVAQFDDKLVTPDIAPELLRIVLDKTAVNLPLFWPELDPDKHLLLTAGQTVLKILSAKPPGGAKWKLQFRADDLLTVTDTVVDELAENPTWLLSIAKDDDKYLGTALEASLTVLRKRADERLSLDIAVDVLNTSIKAVAMDVKFLDKAPDGKPLVASVIDLVFAAVFKPDLGAEHLRAQWLLVQSSTIDFMLNTIFLRFAESPMDEESLQVVKQQIKKVVENAGAGNPINWEEFDQTLVEALRRQTQ
jgi:hypothetical protein